ncbi:MAG: hypothetical protein HUU55_19875 [Myxococcales bacterium]|nr:hypothetical protein [Myxococcales bacterium]
MKKPWNYIFVLCVALAASGMTFSACGEDDDGGQSTTDTVVGDTGGGGDTVVSDAADQDTKTEDTGGGGPDLVSEDTGSGEEDTGTPDMGNPDDGTGADTTDTGTEEDAGPSPMTCAEVAGCALACETLDEACLTGCMANGSPEANAEAQALFTCVQQNCDLEGDVQTCAQEKCVEQVGICFDLGATCGDVWRCNLACVTPDCKAKCDAIQVTTPVGESYSALVSCLNNNCPIPPAQDCIIQQTAKTTGKCGAEASACVPDAGLGLCPPLTECLLTNCAPDDVDCQNTCYATGNIHAQVYAAQYWGCVLINCEYPFTEECLQFAKDDTCSGQWSGCSNQL